MYTFEDFINELKNNDIVELPDMMECAIIEDNDDINNIEVSIWPVYDHHNVEEYLAIDIYNEYF